MLKLGELIDDLLASNHGSENTVFKIYAKRRELHFLLCVVMWYLLLIFLLITALAIVIWQASQIASVQRRNAQLERKVTRLQQELDDAQQMTTQSMGSPASNVEQLAIAGETLNPITFSKQILGMGWRETRGALNVMDRMTRRLIGEAPLPTTVQSELLHLLNAGEKAKATQLYQQTVGVGQQEAQRVIEAMEEALGKRA